MGIEGEICKHGIDVLRYICVECARDGLIRIMGNNGPSTKEGDTRADVKPELLRGPAQRTDLDGVVTE